MSRTRDAILYVGAVLPARSETFVYNELLALGARGVRIHAASVRTPEQHLGEQRLDALAASVIPIYGAGTARLVADALRETLAHPLRAAGVLAWLVADELRGKPLPLLRRLKLVGQALAALALARRVRPLGIGHLHAHMAHVPTTIAMYAARQLGIPFSFTGHANDLFRQQTLLREKLQRAAFVACISHWHRAFYRTFVNLPERRLPIVRCGVELPDRATATGHADRQGVAPRIIAVGRLVPKKGFDLLVAALDRLRDLPWQCEIIGSGPEEQRLSDQVRSLHLADRITLLGAAPHARVRQLVAQADLFVLPCRVDPAGDRDGIPVVLMEAMAAGVPVVSGDLPAIRELVHDGENGALVAPEDMDALVAAIRRLLTDAALRHNWGQAARAWVAQEFSLAGNVDRLWQALHACGARSGSMEATPQTQGEPTTARCTE